ncbi:MAG: S8 family serine peptidase [Acidobacteria bacterium]|nr:S8 family serine peptidase [Acidobacteriota bacterium]
MGTFPTSPSTVSPNLEQTETTGRFLVLLDETGSKEGLNILQKSAGLRIASTADSATGVLDIEHISPTDAVLFDKLGIALVTVAPDQYQSLAATAASEKTPILSIEPERVVYAIQEGAVRRAAVQPAPAAASAPATITTEYLQGYRDAVDRLVDSLVTSGRMPAPITEEEFEAEAQAQVTWGLHRTRVPRSRFSGRGIRVAVLDTGLDLRHPDFAGRSIVSQSFVTGQAVQDGHGHGTHVIGTACGPLQPSLLPRYGVAYNCDIFAGKVLSNQGSGSDGGILAGINWAITNKCSVISMSLGARVFPGQAFSPIFENAARRALNLGTLIIAAAGNDSDRRIGSFWPVSHPANCPSILAVGAVDIRLQMAYFSNRGLDPNGGQVDIAGPGVNVHSSWPMPTSYRSISGTSMATPHVAGIAALIAESNTNARGLNLWTRLQQLARRLPLSSADVGAGLVLAP